jgi:hypothetical protein
LLIQADDVENCPSDWLFALAGCFNNGSIISRDSRQGPSHAIRPARAGVDDALMVAPNAFCSCGATIPGDLIDA